MKKAQVLSAIALALALGVVAPVASTYAENGIMPLAYDDEETAKTTANVAEVKAAISAIENASEYKAYSALAEAKAAAEATPAPKTPAQNLSALKAALAGVNANSYANDADYIALADYAEANVTNYNLWANLVKVAGEANASEAQASYTALSNAMKAIRGGYNTVVSGVENPTSAQLLTQAQTDLTTFAAFDSETNTSSTVYTYTKVKAVVDAVNDANTTETVVADLEEALAGVGVEEDDIETAAGNADPIAALKALITGDVATKAGAYDALIAQVASVKNDLKTPESLSATALYNLIDNSTNGLLQLTKIATGNTKLTVADLLSGAGTTTPTDPTDPTTPEDPTTPSTTVSDGDVTVTGSFATSVKVKATKTDKKVAAFGDRNYAVYDIYLTDANDDKVNVEGSVKVSIKVPANIDGSKASVYYITPEDEGQKIANATYADGYITFTTTHFSYYAIVEDEGKLDTTLPNTGIMTTASGTASSTVAVVAGIATALTAAGAGVVAYRNARRSTKE